ncbi:MAG: InlB B-repeat-containing protein [Clostridia bacterium]|nr:InlB B-repeat-containing protein [Clostridia bacterium]
MRLIKRTFRLFIVALLSFAFVLSISACKTRNPQDNDGNDDDDNTIQTPVIPPEVTGDTSGIDWTKYWDGTTSGGGADGFTFNKSISIGDVSSTPVGGTVSTELGEGIAVTFNSNGGTAVETQSVEADGIAVKPTDPVKSGSLFVGWYEDSSLSTAYDFDATVTEPVTLFAKWQTLPDGVKSVSTYNESFAVEFTGTADTTVQYKAKDASTWSTVDAPLVRSVGSGTARVDVVGIEAGEYSVKIGGTEVNGINVEAYDRSGYAHFDRKSTEAAYTGVGAYKDDGTIKNNTLVIYVTEQNKNTVKTGYVDGKEVDLTPYLWQGKAGIGWILNNRGYENNTARENYGIQKLTSQYGAVAVRILGKVNAEESTGKISLVEGLTDYNSTGNGGSTGDNGRMARITNAKNLTIEGIGEDACIYGWGIHFVSNDNLHKYAGSGTSFEVRNITFEHYPEDAIGMEGTQGTKVDATGSITGGASDAGADLISPVERCWVHNNTFMQGYSAAPAESDKKDGDGSCDFKRGQYYTLSYNYFEECHKTNLIGSSDTSLTYNVTIHHNWYKAVQSRQPLARRANIHYYNNYVSDASDYVTSFRANCLVFSEANYYDGCKNVTQKKDGVGVAWNNIYYACYSENLYTELTSRTQTVTNSCKFIYRNLDYSQFYTNPNQFYYDSANEVSDCLLDSASGARIRVMMSSGVNGFGLSSHETAMNQYTPDKAVAVTQQGVSVDLKSVAKGSSIVSNVAFNGITGVSSGVIKGKGQIITFTLTAPTEVKITTSTTGDPSPELVDSYGRVWAAKFNGSLTVVLPKGTYFIGTGQKDKEAQISALSFEDTEASSDARVAEAESALAAIPSNITLNDEVYVKAAQAAYGALRSDEQGKIDSELYEKLGKAITAVNQLKADYVVARIDYIGTVTIDSYNKINAAQTAYSELSATLQSQVTNYSTLAAAWTTYGEFAAQNVINKILDLPKVENIQKINSMEILDRAQIWFDAVSGAFDGLTSEEGHGQQGQVKTHDDGKTYAILTDGLEALGTRRAELEKAAAEAEALVNFLAALDEITDVNNLTVAECTAIVNLFNSLSDEKQAEYAGNEIYTAIEAKLEEASKQMQETNFTGSNGTASNPFFTVTGSTAKNAQFEVKGYGTFNSGVKMESKTSISFTLESKMTLTLFLDATGKSVKINDSETADSAADANGNYVITVTLEKGTYSITKSDSVDLYYAILTPAN